MHEPQRSELAEPNPQIRSGNATRRDASCSLSSTTMETMRNSPIPHDTLWFSDGNVVLATDSQLFKVHKSVLSMQSSVFRDMFELSDVRGSIADGTFIVGIMPELYEGLPLVPLVGEKGEDVVHLLRAIYERRCVFLLIFSSTSLLLTYT